MSDIRRIIDLKDFKDE